MPRWEQWDMKVKKTALSTRLESLIIQHHAIQVFVSTNSAFCSTWHEVEFFQLKLWITSEDHHWQSIVNVLCIDSCRTTFCRLDKQDDHFMRSNPEILLQTLWCNHTTPKQKRWISWSYWWKKSCTMWDVQNLVNNGISTTNLNWWVSKISNEPSTVCLN